MRDLCVEGFVFLVRFDREELILVFINILIIGCDVELQFFLLQKILLEPLRDIFHRLLFGTVFFFQLLHNLWQAFDLFRVSQDLIVEFLQILLKS